MSTDVYFYTMLFVGYLKKSHCCGYFFDSVLCCEGISENKKLALIIGPIIHSGEIYF